MVVLAILVALVGLVLAFFPGLLSRASRSTSASSIQDVARAVQVNYTTALTYGTGYDSLLNTGGAALFSKLAPLSAAQMGLYPLIAGDVTALGALGIQGVRHLDNTIVNDATFKVSAALATPLTTGNDVAVITNPGVQQALRGNYVPAASPQYVVVGLNKLASIVGGNQMLQDAPVRAGADANENPTTSYQRYGLAFLIDNSGPGATRRARFIGACAFSGAGITTAEGDLQQYYAN